MNKKKYDFREVEEKIKNYWDREKLYKFDLNKSGKIYTVDTPPPTVSGAMHVGHAFSYSQQDFIVRFHRMNCNVFYPFGTDDNGLPTERLIEKLKNVKSKNMSRAEFIKLCLTTLKKIIPDFVQDWKNLGISCDYYTTYSTIDDNSRKISQKSFIELFKKGEIYEKNFPTLWCPECQTTIAQAELEDKEMPSKFSTLRFKCDNEELLIATTRPELLGACVCVFVHPNDKRYKKYIGKKAKVPLFDFEVPIIADESADPEKGTGVLMVCSYGDKYDVDAINRYKLEPKMIIRPDGTMKLKDYEGLKIKEVRKKILKDLEKNGLIKEQKEIKHTVNVHDKCGTEIEFVETEQWFIKLLDKKEKLIKQGQKINWYPSFMYKRYENWVRGLEWDWSISRDRHFGVPIPVWKCEKCNQVILPDEKELPIDPIQTQKKCPKCGVVARPETKVLDTWATSSLTPQIAASLFDDKIRIPFSLRPQAHDIIRTWAFYTITKSFLHENKIPWKDVIVSGFVTRNKEKMSKSKGNGIDPKEILNEYGADALRFWAASSGLGEDLDYQEKDLITGKKFATKLWNATKFVFMNLEDYNLEKPKNIEKIDELFLEKLNILVKNCTKNFEIYQYSKVKSDVETFFWKMFCDNYLEIIKKRIYNESGERKISAQYTLYKSLLTILKLIAPIMPFITEEIYLNYFKLKGEKEKSIHLTNWPKTKEIKNDEKLDLFLKILGKVRQEKTNNKKSMKSEIKLTVSDEDFKNLGLIIEDLKDVTNAAEIKKGKFKIEFIENGTE